MCPRCFLTPYGPGQQVAHVVLGLAARYSRLRQRRRLRGF